MKLLFDQNISHRVVPLLADVYPGASHVRDLALHDAMDRAIWDFAANDGWVIVSKDGDFHQLSLLFGAPPKVIWLRVGNRTTAELAQLLRSKAPEVAAFLDAEESLLILGGS